MSSDTRTARATGILFLITFVSAIAGVALYAPVLHDPGYVAGPGADARIALGWSARSCS